VLPEGPGLVRLSCYRIIASKPFKDASLAHDEHQHLIRLIAVAAETPIRTDAPAVLTVCFSRYETSVKSEQTQAGRGLAGRS
jgi:hypothetical protein